LSLRNERLPLPINHIYSHAIGNLSIRTWARQDRRSLLFNIFSPVRQRATLFLPREKDRMGRRMGGRLITGSNESGLLAHGS